MSEQIKIGVLGCGRIVQRRVLPAMEYATEGVVTAIASNRPDVAKEVCREHGIASRHQTYEDILSDDRIDAVYIPATGDQHCRWTVAAAEAGKHVLCEKPLAPTLKEAETMVAACDRAGVVLQEAFMWRHHPRAQRLKELVSEGAIGELAMICVSFSFDLDRTDWRMLPERGGGAMWDLGCYGVNLSRFLTDEEPSAISAAARWSDSGVDMTMRMGLSFPSHVLANIDCSFEAPFRCRADIVGTGGRILLDHAFQPDQDSTIQLWRSTNREEPMNRIKVDPADQYACQIDHFCRSIRNGKLSPPAENGLKNMTAMQQVLNAAR